MSLSLLAMRQLLVTVAPGRRTVDLTIAAMRQSPAARAKGKIQQQAAAAAARRN
jgi:hypothetical protein